MNQLTIYGEYVFFGCSSVLYIGFKCTLSFVDSDDVEPDVDTSRIRVATGFIFNEKAVRKLVPNKPRWLGSLSDSGGDQRDNPLNKEV